MNSGRSCAEVTVVQKEDGMMIGVARPTLDPNTVTAYNTEFFWGIHSGNGGMLFHNDGDRQDWEGMEEYGEGDAVSYTHLRAHETSLHLVCRLLLEKKKKK